MPFISVAQDLINMFPPGSYAMPSPNFANEEQLIAALEVNDPVTPSPDTEPRYLYRGQAQRVNRQWPPKNIEINPTINQHSYTFDSVIPTDYRDMETLITSITSGQASDPNFQIAYDSTAAYLRALITYLAIDRWIVAYPDVLHSSLPQEVSDWFQSLITPQPGIMPFDRVGSIGQHCELLSRYTDATSSKQVALWFASHSWSNGNYIQNGQGVVYRINYKVLCQAEDDLNSQIGLTGDNRYRHVDIRQTPQIVCPRPFLQNGWSLINFESPRLLLELIHRDAIEAFVFVRGSSSSSVNTLNKQNDIAPEPDGVKSAIDILYHEPSNANLHYLIDAHLSDPGCYHQLLSQSSAVDIIFHGLHN